MDREAARAQLQSWLDRTPSYLGDGPKAEHYRHNRAVLETAILALSPTRPDVEGLKVGDRVCNVKGLPFGGGDAVVVAIYTAEGGARVVVQHPEGWQHIFTPGQLALSTLQTEQGRTGE